MISLSSLALAQRGEAPPIFMGFLRGLGEWISKSPVDDFLLLVGCRDGDSPEDLRDLLGERISRSVAAITNFLGRRDGEFAPMLESASCC
jgi:hypothetical protein